jgi:hypothetical protein
LLDPRPRIVKGLSQNFDGLGIKHPIRDCFDEPVHGTPLANGNTKLPHLDHGLQKYTIALLGYHQRI